MWFTNRIAHLFPPFLKDKVTRIRRRRKLKKLENTHHFSKEQIVYDLRKLGLKYGDIILLHGSLSSIGYVEGGANTVIDALIQVVGPNGTLCMPCLSLPAHGSMVETLQRGLTFDSRSTPSTVGVIAETFRKRMDTLRSIHPTHSICAWGQKAKLITSGHENATNTFGPGTPWYKIMEEGGLILGLGIDFGPVTFLHVFEDTVSEFPLKVYSDMTFDARIIGKDGKEATLKIRAHDPQTSKTRINHEEGKWIRRFLVEYLTGKGLLHVGYVGRAKCWVIKAKYLFEAQKELLKLGITIYTTKDQYQSNPHKGIV